MSSADLPAEASRSWAELLLTYFRPRALTMLGLGFAAGLPFLLVFGTLSAWLTEAKVSLTMIGFASYIGLAYAFKFLWAPLVDQVRLPVLDHLFGRRRAWMLLAQSGVVIGLVAMSQIDPGQSLAAMVVAALLVAFSSATQDIAVDAWRIEAAPDEAQLAVLSAVYQLGYRFGLIAAGAGALYVAEYVSWPAAYLSMAALMGLGILSTLLAFRPDDPPRAASPSAKQGPIEAAVAAMLWLYRAIVAPFIDFFRRNRWLALLILLAVGFYRIPDFVSGVMANPFYLKLGFSKAEIAEVSKLYGIWITILGAFIGGASAQKFGLMRTLIIGVVIASASNLCYAWLATVGPQFWALIFAVSLENLSGGFAGTALIAYMSSLTSKAFTATQYALFSSAFALPGKLIAGFSGYMVDTAFNGFYWFFIATAAMGIPALLLVLLLIRLSAPGSAMPAAKV